MNYFEMNSLIQSKLASILSSNDKRGLLNSYIVEYGFKIKEYISEKLNEKHINGFAVEDIHWVQYILDYIKNQISLYLIVIDETENSFAERNDELLSSVQDYKDELKKNKRRDYWYY